MAAIQYAKCRGKKRLALALVAAVQRDRLAGAAIYSPHNPLPDGDAIVIERLDLHLSVHTTYLVGDDEADAIELWRQWRTSNNALPVAGGVLDQPLAPMRTIRYLETVYQALTRKVE